MRKSSAPTTESWVGRTRRTVRTDPRFAGMLAAGGAVLVISMLAHFRVPILPDIGVALNLSAFELGLITTAFAAGRLIFDIPTGSFADRFAPTRMFGGAAAALGLGSLIMAAAPNGAVTLVAGFVLGVSTAIANTTGQTFFATRVSARNRGRAMAGFSASLLGGQAIGPSFGGVLAGLAGWRAALVVASVVAFGVLATLRPWRASLATYVAPDGTTGGDPLADLGAGRERISRAQRVILYSVPFAAFFTLGSLPQTLVPIIGSRVYGLNAAAIGLALGLGGVCRFIGAVTGGFVSDRVSRKAALIPGMGLMALGVSLLALDVGVWAWIASIVVMSLASFGVSVAATMLADHANGQQVGRRLGPFRFVGDLGLLAGPTLTTAIFAAAGRQAAVLTVVGLLVVIALLCAVALTETRRASDHPVSV